MHPFFTKALSGIKFYMDLMLVNTLLDEESEEERKARELNKSYREPMMTMESLQRLTLWRTEHMGNIPMDKKIDMQTHESPEEKKRIRTAFLMGIDPLKYRKMKTLPGQLPETHRVTVFLDKHGDFEVEFHHLLSSTTTTTTTHSSDSTPQPPTSAVDPLHPHHHLHNPTTTSEDTLYTFSALSTTNQTEDNTLLSPQLHHPHHDTLNTDNNNTTTLTP